MLPRVISHRLPRVRAVLPFFVLCVAGTVAHSQPVVIETPEAAKESADFAVQGEYRGDHRAMQVIARGNGEFDLLVYEGGLPGAGWNGTPARPLQGDADVVADLVESMELKRVERTSPTLGAAPPADAVVLFDGTPESIEAHWEGGRLSPDGFLMQGTTSKDTFQDYQLHLEFRTPFMPRASGQARGNSGVYHQGRYETQILDSFGLKGANNETGGIYTVSDPSVNTCFPPLSWQTYDVDFTAARYDDAGKVTSPARLTVRLNGIVVQSDVTVPGPTPGAPRPAGPEAGPIYLQDHGNPVRYRNIWVLPRDADREARRPIVPGFERFYASMSEPAADGGELLISTLACEACHAASGNAMLPAKLGPDLSEVAGRVQPRAILEMIQRPHATKPGTSMPDPWVGLSDDQRQQRAAAITSYLVSHSRGELRYRTVPASIAREGRELFQSIGCVACHSPVEGEAAPAATSIPLGRLHTKYTLPSLAKFLLEPHAVRPGGRMPALTQSPAEASRIAAYLLREAVVRPVTATFQRRVYRGQWQQLPAFEDLEPVQSDEVVGLKIDDIQPVQNYAVLLDATLNIARDGEYAFRLTSDDGSRISVGDQRLENDGIHPATSKTGRLRLTAGKHPVQVSYFQGGGEAVLQVEMRDPELGWIDLASVIDDRSGAAERAADPWQPEPSLAESGRELFAASGCVNCHRFDPDPELARVAQPSLAKLDPRRGCLAAPVRGPAVDYQLSPAQRAAIALAIHQRSLPAEEVGDETRSHQMLAAWNCYACHSRDGIGGVEAARDTYFHTTTPEMGLEGRLPPPLDGVGDKLNDAYFVKLLEQGADERPYMSTRMPGFGYEPLRSWHESVKRLDRRDDVAPVATHDTPGNLIGAGRTCVGNRGLACIKCHGFGGESGGGIGAMDMLKMPERLRQEWFVRYLLDPQAYRPGTRMPASFVDGISALTSVYDGDPEKQIHAMWRYLSLGSEAKVPDGLVEGGIVLVPEDRPRIYRNFLAGLSGRGIAVGYPGGVNLIWDADRMTLAKLWKNDFIDASMHWNNRGSGDQQPLGDAVIDFNQAASIGCVKSLDEPWPGEPLRLRGGKFLGYILDQEGRPTFRYRVDGCEIKDHIAPSDDETANGPTSQLTVLRQLTVEPSPSAADRMLVWSIARGKIEKLRPDTYRINDAYTVTVGGAASEIVRVGDHDEIRATLSTKQPTQVWQRVTW